MKIKDAEEIRVKITYVLEWDEKAVFEELNSNDIIKQSEEECVNGSGSHDYEIEGWNGMYWETIED